MLVALARPTQEKRARQQRAMDLKELQARAKIVAATSAPAATASQMIKLSSVVDRADDREEHLMVQAQVDSAYVVYNERIGDLSRPVENASLEQLATLRAPVSCGAPPYVDLAVCGPY